MNVERFIAALGADFYTGVPDSQLKALCDYLMDRYGTDGTHHIIGANEGTCTAIAAGYHLATGNTPVVYLQNSGQGNMINPLASLLSPHVYGIPCIFVIGWRGEPGVPDEPQHRHQGLVTVELMNALDVPVFILSADTGEDAFAAKMEEFRGLLQSGRQVAIVVRKGALKYHKEVAYHNGYTMLREEIIRHITDFSGDDPIVSTTGKASRELFEIREARHQDHSKDFLTVGSMGHSSSIALGIALQQPGKKVWIIDGDSAALMHLGAMAVLGAQKPENVVHIVINNGAHETVGGQPSVMGQVDLATIATGCGYSRIFCAHSFAMLDQALNAAKTGSGLCLIEVTCAIGARADLGRPTTTARSNKEAFMEYLQNA